MERNRRVIILFLCGLLGGSWRPACGHAEDPWEDVTPPVNNPVVVIGDHSPGSLVISDDSVISLDEFERAGADDADISHVSKQAAKNSRKITNLSSAIDTQAKQIDQMELSLRHLSDELSEAISVAAALDFQRPLPGKHFRLGLGGGTYESEAAVGVTLSAVAAEFDFGVGIAFSSNETLGKGSVGFSFW